MAGTKSRVTNVAKKMPNASETIVGLRNCASVERSNIIGSKPINVVKDVSMIGRKRPTPAFTKAS